MHATVQPPTRERRSAALEPTEIGLLVALAVLGGVWGAAIRRSAALADLASVAPILLTVIGPGGLLVYLAQRIATGRLAVRTDVAGAAALVLGGVVGLVATPSLSTAAVVAGHVSGTLDGVAVDAAGACTWGPGRTSVVLVATTLPEDSANQMFSKSLPGGTLQISLPAGSAVLTNIHAPDFPASLPMRNGSGTAGPIGPGSGALTFDPAAGAVVAGDLSWTCDAPPAG